MFSYLLTSNSFHNPNIKLFFENVIIGRGYKSVGIVTTANPQKENAIWATVTEEYMRDIGLKTRFIDFEKQENIENEDIIYVCGGNTFALIHYAREVGFRDAIERLSGYNGLYIGSSAGSVIAGPLVECASLGPYKDDNSIGCTDMTGLELVDFNIFPHYKEEFQPILTELEKKRSIKTMPVKDDEALWVVDGIVTKIS